MRQVGMDEALIERWLRNPAYREELAELGGLDPARADVEAIRRHTREHIAGMQSRADEVFNRFLDLVGRPQRRITLPSREWV